MVTNQTMRLLSILSVVVVRVSAQSDGCTLQCHEHATCRMGEADFSNHSTYEDGTPLDIHKTTSQNGMHCVCPSGWTGLTCNRIYNSCDEDHKCYNGGNCIPGILDYYGNEQLFCDCSNAVDEEGFPYVGKFCEHSGKEKCGTDDDNHFCVNGGECNDGYPDDDGKPCNCEPGFVGPHCEFREDNVPECTLTCENSGSCQLGLPYEPQTYHDLLHLFATNTGTKEDLMYCVCPPKVGGKLCDVKKTEDPCGSHECYNGGTCVTRVDDSGDTKHHCDCTTAETETTSYAGRFCQYESTSFCSKEDNQNGQLFCTNGGVCSEDDFDGCVCKDDFFGPSCEFKYLPEVADSITNSSSSIEHTSNYTPPKDETLFNGGEHVEGLHSCVERCQNGGKCRRGSKDLGIISGIAPHVDELNQTFDNNFEHCVCQEGFVGLHCEHKIEICPGSQHFCLHGSKCVATGDEASCDCSASSDFSNLAGRHCQHKNSAMCVKGDLSPIQPRSFCVNGGSCNSVVSSASDPHPGCSCVGEWEGPHCELRSGVLVTSAAVESTGATQVPPASVDATESQINASGNDGDGSAVNNTSTAILVVGILALISSVLFAIGTGMRNREDRRRLENHRYLTTAMSIHRDEEFNRSSSKREINFSRSSSKRDVIFSRSSSKRDLDQDPINFAAGEPEVYLGPPRDEDGHVLHNVDIL